MDKWNHKIKNESKTHTLKKKKKNQNGRFKNDFIFLGNQITEHD